LTENTSTGVIGFGKTSDWQEAWIMNNSPMTNSILVSVRVYRALLIAYPKKFRENYETQMVQVFRDSLRETHHRYGLAGVIDLWLHTCADLLVTALMERISERSQYMFSPKVILWGGVSGLFSGMLWMMMGLAPASAGVAGVLALILGLGGLVGLYSRQAGQGGRLGLAGFALGIIGTVLALVTLLWDITFFSGSSYREINSHIAREPVLAAQAVLISMLAFVTLGIGLTLLGAASLRAKTLHRWRGLPLGLGLLNTIQGITGWVIFYMPLSQGRNPWDPWNPRMYLPTFVVFVLLGIGWIGLGLMLATEAEAKIAQPPPASA
jgi:hypothetical protein